MGTSYPTERPIDAEYASDASPAPPELLSMPWVDVHNHAHTLSWNDRERYSLSGCRAMVMMAAAYYWNPYKPVHSDDIRYLWDDALNRLHQIRNSHLFDAKIGVGIHTGTNVEEYEALLDAMSDYCELDEVAAIGETGITAKQHVDGWSLDEQREVMRAQMTLARDHDLPIVLHTPPNSADDRDVDLFPEYEVDLDLQEIPELTPSNAKREAVDIDLELATEVDLPDEQVVFSHADRSIVPHVIKSTDCYVSYTIGKEWLTGLAVEEVADAIKEYGPDQILMETDNVGILRGDVFAYKRAIFELYRRGVDLESIKTVVHDNPLDVLDES